MAKLLFIDTETTSVKPHACGVHQIAGSVWVNGERKEDFSFTVAPHEKAEVTAEALAVSGKSFAEIHAYPTRYAIHDVLKTILSKYVDQYDKRDKFFLCGYNVQAFDTKVLYKWFNDCGDPYFYSWIWNATIDLMVLAGQRLMNERHLMNDFKLPTVARHLGIEVEDSKLHDAAYDVYLCEQIYAKMYQPSINYQPA